MPTAEVRDLGRCRTRSVASRDSVPRWVSISWALARWIAPSAPGVRPAGAPAQPAAASSAIECSISTASHSGHGLPAVSSVSGVSRCAATTAQSSSTSSGAPPPLPSMSARQAVAASATVAAYAGCDGGGQAAPDGGETTKRNAWDRSSRMVVRAATSGAQSRSPVEGAAPVSQLNNWPTVSPAELVAGSFARAMPGLCHVPGPGVADARKRHPSGLLTCRCSARNVTARRGP